MDKKDYILFNLIKLSLWGIQTEDTIDREIFAEMKDQSLIALPTSGLTSLKMPETLLREWKACILQHVSYNLQYGHMESTLNLSVPYVILKGSSAAQYYPEPELRTQGDIDIMTKREDFDAAFRQLINDGYVVVNEENRETALIKNGIVVELHRRFASLNDIEQAKYLDELIVQHINPSHVLPDLVNGLTLLEHISQHLENGLGLRQIIDWMMFVDKCLPDNKWKDFSILAQKTGLETLAITVTHMCELYLGLSGRKWSEKADVNLCEQLMNYILSCGNFGNKRTSDADISQNVFAYASTVKTAYRLLQRQGLCNWKAAQKHSVLKPFAWIYQANRYIFRGLRRNRAVYKLRDEFTAAKRRNKMFHALGVKTAAKRIVIYKNGKYVKE